jgi:hypothetical protein
MDEKRFDELSRKRFQGGLSHDEADELGRMMAEKEGEHHSNADEREHPERVRSDGREPEDPYNEDEARELRDHPDVRGEERKAG